MYSKAPGTTAVPNSTIESAKFNQTIDDIAQDLNFPRPITAGGTGSASVAAAQTALSVVGYTSQSLTAAQQAQARSNVGAALKGQIEGLTIANSVADAINDIDIAAGEASSSETNPVLIVLTSALTKRLDAAWAVGNGNGGWLDGASMPNGPGHAFLIQRSDTGVVDVGFSATLTPVLPTGYDRKRRIGSILRSAGAILPFTQKGSRFLLNSGIIIRNSTAAASNILLNTGVPTGFRLAPILSSTMLINGASSGSNSVGDGDMSVASLPFQANNTPGGVSSANNNVISGEVFTDTSGQIRWSTTINSGSISSNVVTMFGWFDDRGAA